MSDVLSNDEHAGKTPGNPGDTPGSPPANASPLLSASELAEMASFGVERQVAAGELDRKSVV